MSFDTEKYYTNQVDAFSKRLEKGDVQVIEFGGKPFGDYHAARVLPDYNPDVKARILQDLHKSLGNVTITLALNTMDVIAPPDGRRINQRIRGDSGLRYDDEVLRLVEQSRTQFNLPIDSITLTSFPSQATDENTEYIEMYTERLNSHDLAVKRIDYIPGYPLLNPDTITSTLTQFEPISDIDQHLIVASPGGGSGKFSVAITEIAHKLQGGKNANFTKFETFPVFNLNQDHPLNVAFLAATADLPNSLSTTGDGKTSYDKDIQNLGILQSLMLHYSELDSPLHQYEEPADMGVNVIETGIIDEEGVTSACLHEIARRIERYKKESRNGDEQYNTVDRTISYLGSLGIAQQGIDQKAN